MAVERSHRNLETWNTNEMKGEGSEVSPAEGDYIHILNRQLPVTWTRGRKAWLRTETRIQSMPEDISWSLLCLLGPTRGGGSCRVSGNSYGVG